MSTVCLDILYSKVALCVLGKDFKIPQKTAVLYYQVPTGSALRWLLICVRLHCVAVPSCYLYLHLLTDRESDNQSDCTQIYCHCLEVIISTIGRDRSYFQQQGPGFMYPM